MKKTFLTALLGATTIGGAAMGGGFVGADLVGPEWVIEDIAGRGIIDMSFAHLLFLEDGSLAGNSSCNLIIGSYTEADGRLEIEPTGSTMMACPEALMNQEARLLALLPQITSYRFDDTGALVLEGGDGTTITARARDAG